MSDFPGEIMKQILLPPPRIMRSTRYSLTAQGRSAPPSIRLPTGSNSLEKARGWMRLPRPAAGMIPHMVLRTHCYGFGRGSVRMVESFEQSSGSMLGSVLIEHALARRRCDRPKCRFVEVQRLERVIRRAGEENFSTRREKRFQSLPSIGEDGSSTGRRLEQSARRAPAHPRHVGAGNVESEP